MPACYDQRRRVSLSDIIAVRRVSSPLGSLSEPLATVCAIAKLRHLRAQLDLVCAGVSLSIGLRISRWTRVDEIAGDNSSPGSEVKGVGECHVVFALSLFNASLTCSSELESSTGCYGCGIVWLGGKA